MIRRKRQSDSIIIRRRLFINTSPTKTRTQTQAMPINGRGYGGTKARATAAAALGAQHKAKPTKAMKVMKAMKEAPKAPMFAHFKANKIKDPTLRDECVAAHKESSLVCFFWKLS